MLQGRLLASQLAEARQLGQHVQASLLPHIEQLLLVDFPLRSASALDKVDVGNGFKLDEVSVSLKVCLLKMALAIVHLVCQYYESGVLAALLLPLVTLSPLLCGSMRNVPPAQLQVCFILSSMHVEILPRPHATTC